MAKQRLSGWARLWIVIGAIVQIAGVIIGFQTASQYAADQALYIGEEITGAQYWLYVGGGALVGLAYAVALFVIAMIAKGAALWVWRGFRPPKSEHTETRS